METGNEQRVTDLHSKQRCLLPQTEDETLRMLLNATTDLVKLIDCNGTIIVANEAMASRLGRTADELVGMSPADVYGLQESINRQKPIDEVIHSKKPLHGEGRCDDRWYSFRLSPLFNEEGEVVQLALFSHDISEHKQAESALRESRDQLRNLAIQLAHSEEAGRKEITRELHDRIGQKLAVLGISLNVALSQLPDDERNDVCSRLADCLVMLGEMTEEIRDVMSELRPPVLDDHGLLAALRWYGSCFEERTGISVQVLGRPLVPRLGHLEEENLFRIAQEVLANTANHSQATETTITVEPKDAAVHMVISDDGIGFPCVLEDDPGRRYGWGLLTMRERALSVGGSLTVNSHPSKGTTILVEIPR